MLRAARCIGVTAAVAFGAVAYLALHFLEPPLAITWSYAHLHRAAVLPWLAGVLVCVAPVATTILWRRPWAERELGRVSWRGLVGGGIVAGSLLLPIGFRFPAPMFSIDVGIFSYEVKTGMFENSRWHLLLWTMKRLSRWFGGGVDPSSLIRVTNTVFFAVALVALAATARRLARTQGEAAAVCALAWSAFGVVQLGMGYVDIYPFPLAVMAVYCAAGLGAIAGDVHPVWPLSIAAIAPFWYIGLVLLAPSVPIVILESWRRRRESARLALAGAVAVALMGLATIPGFGSPFAWRAFLAAVVRDSVYQAGLDPNSSLLPFDFMLSGLHAREVFHTLLLVDGIGWLLVLVLGVWAALRFRNGWDAKAVFLTALLLPYLAYVVAMDPLFGSYADWDLFSYGAIPSSLLGGYALVLWGRECPGPFPLLLGLCLAAAGVHLLARVNALNVDLVRHLAESPYHMPFK